MTPQDSALFFRGETALTKSKRPLARGSKFAGGKGGVQVGGGGQGDEEAVLLGAPVEEVVDGYHADYEQDDEEGKEPGRDAFSRTLIASRKSGMVPRVTESI